MGYWLLDHPNPSGPNFYPTRRACQHGRGLHLLVQHTSEQLPDYQLPDYRAEQLAKYASTTDRQVSWHASVDADSHVPMLPPGYTGWHVRGFNRCGWGIEHATQAAQWDDAPEAWVDGILTQSVKAQAPVAIAYGIPIRRLNGEQATNGNSGLVAHADLDPTRRSDPGVGFPWADLLTRLERAVNGDIMDTTVVLGLGKDRDLADIVASYLPAALATDSADAAGKAHDAGATLILAGGPACDAHPGGVAGSKAPFVGKSGDRIISVRGRDRWDTLRLASRIGELAG